MLTFGKHNGRNLEWLLHNDANYLTYLMGQDWFKKNDMYTELIKMNFNLSPTINFGIYKGWSLADIKATHKRYYAWIKVNADELFGRTNQKYILDWIAKHPV